MSVPLKVCMVTGAGEAVSGAVVCPACVVSVSMVFDVVTDSVLCC